METKNLILAVVLSLIVLFGWGRFSEYMGWTPQVQAPAQQESAPAEKPVPKAQPLPTFESAPGRDLEVDTPLYKAIFYTGGGTLRSFILKKYKTGILQDSPQVNMVDPNTAKFAPLGLVINGQPSWSTGEWSQAGDKNAIILQEVSSETLTLSGLVDNLRVQRRFELKGDTYLIGEKIVVANESSQPRSLRLSFTQAMDSSLSSGSQYDSMRIAWDKDGKLDDETSLKTLQSTGVQANGKIWWAGPMSTYFLAAALPANPNDITVKGRVEGTVYRTGVEQPEIYLGPGQSAEFDVSYWTGPKDRAQLMAVSEQLAKSIDLGFFSIIAKFLLWILEYTHQYVHNWGIAIIILTVIIRLVFWPLTAKSFASMEKMKQLQPVIKKIQEKYKDNREEMNKEVMAVYRNYKINPASGCVPILVQLPVFFGLYQALLTSIALRHASLITYLPGTHIIWLADLSAKDPLYITPIIMGLSMFAQQRMSPPPADPMQRKVMMFLPLIFTVLFLSFPSGLVIYWLFNNLLSIFQQWLMMRKQKKSKGNSDSARDRGVRQENG